MEHKYYFNKDELDEYLLKVQRICRMTEEDALVELDAFLKEFVEMDQETELEVTEEHDYGCELSDLENQLEKTAKWAIDLDSFDRAGHELISFWDLKRRIEDSKDYWNDTAPDSLKPKYQDLFDKLDKTNKLVEVYHAAHIINGQKEKSRNIPDSRVKERILESLERAMSKLESPEQLNDKIRAEVREIKEKCAWYRANKTMLDMELATKCGQEERAEKLRVKAQAQLEQDWARLFGEEQPPAIIGSTFTG